MASPVRVIEAKVWARGTGGQDAAVQAPMGCGGVLDDEHLDAGGLAAEGEALEEAQYDQAASVQ